MGLFLRLLTAAGALTVLSTEILGAFHAIGPLPLALVWCAAAIAAALALRGRIAPPRLDLGSGAVLVVIGGILALTALTALACPPNSVDAFGYHLSRVVWWAQQRSVEFFPTHYLPQLFMPPMAEYAMLHSFVLTGGDRLVNLVQWTGFAGSIAAAALLAREFGCGHSAQYFAALFCATLPNAILQASGAKNDCVLALWLAAAACFALRWRREPTVAAAVWLGLALGLALATKATAWLFAPPALLCLLAPALRTHPRELARAAALVALCVVALNGPQWRRNPAAFGSPLGPATAQADQDPHYRWTVERPGLGATLSNAVRHLSQQLGSRDERQNQRAYRSALNLHGLFGLDPNDPATTWPETQFAPPRNANHEADAPNRVHLITLFLAFAILVHRRGQLFAWSLALLAAFLLVCATLKYQPYFSRVFVPLFVLGAPLAAAGVQRVMRPAILQTFFALLLLDQTRHPLLHNWTRPLDGPGNVLETAREPNYFRDMAQFHTGYEDYRRAADAIVAQPCALAGIDNQRFHLEYPLQILLRRRDPAVRFVHTGIAGAPAQPAPCAVVCLGCAADGAKRAAYAGWGEPVELGPHLLYRRGGRITAATAAPAAANTASFP